MKELIKIQKRHNVNLVCASDLHAFLEVETPLTKWVKRMSEYGFKESVDWTKLSSDNQLIEYGLTLDCAKHWAMMQRTEKGMRARQYFIDFEIMHKNQTPELPKTFAQALRLAAEQAEKLEALEPKGKVYDQIIESDNLLTLNDAAKSIGIGRNNMMRELRLMNILRRNNTPFQAFIDRGYFQVKVKPVVKGESVENYTQTFVTGKGLVWLSKKLSD